MIVYPWTILTVFLLRLSPALANKKHWPAPTSIYNYTVRDGETREFRDVVFEDVVFDNNSSVTPY